MGYHKRWGEASQHRQATERHFSLVNSTEDNLLDISLGAILSRHKVVVLHRSERTDEIQKVLKRQREKFLRERQKGNDNGMEKRRLSRQGEKSPNTLRGWDLSVEASAEVKLC